MSLWDEQKLREFFLTQTPTIDVRAPVEFNAGFLPNSVNLPLMNDEERRLVGLCYKERGQAEALQLGHQLVSGEVRAERIKAWVEHLRAQPDAQVMCFRGGLRSQISCQWLAQWAIKREPIPGGYKRLRQFLLNVLEVEPLPFLVRLGGYTGVGKTELLQSIPHGLDLERLAHHRGSAFGYQGSQPSQASFENELAATLLGKKVLVVEDESVMLGSLRLPRRFHQRLIESPLVVLEASMEERIKNIHRDYVLANNRDFFLKGIERIAKKLGGARSRELSQKVFLAFNEGLAISSHADWIEYLLRSYYDPAYEFGLRQQGALIRARGDRGTVLSLLCRGERV